MQTQSHHLVRPAYRTFLSGRSDAIAPSNQVPPQLQRAAKSIAIHSVGRFSIRKVSAEVALSTCTLRSTHRADPNGTRTKHLRGPKDKAGCFAPKATAAICCRVSRDGVFCNATHPITVLGRTGSIRLWVSTSSVGIPQISCLVGGMLHSWLAI